MEVNPSFQNSSHDPSFWMIFARGITPRVFEFETRSEKQTCCSDIPTSRQVPCDSYWIGQLNREKLEERLRAQPLAVCWRQYHNFTPHMDSIWWIDETFDFLTLVGLLGQVFPFCVYAEGVTWYYLIYIVDLLLLKFNFPAGWCKQRVTWGFIV